jgi:hypothetical protein
MCESSGGEPGSGDCLDFEGALDLSGDDDDDDDGRSSLIPATRDVVLGGIIIAGICVLASCCFVICSRIMNRTGKVEPGATDETEDSTADQEAAVAACAPPPAVDPATTSRTADAAQSTALCSNCAAQAAAAPIHRLPPQCPLAAVSSRGSSSCGVSGRLPLGPIPAAVPPTQIHAPAGGAGALVAAPAPAASGLAAFSVQALSTRHSFNMMRVAGW